MQPRLFDTLVHEALDELLREPDVIAHKTNSIDLEGINSVAFGARPDMWFQTRFETSTGVGKLNGGQSKRRIATWRADRDCRRKPNMSKISDRLMIVRRSSVDGALERE